MLLKVKKTKLVTSNQSHRRLTDNLVEESKNKLNFSHTGSEASF